MDPSPRTLDRRTFLKVAGATGGLLAVGAGGLVDGRDAQAQTTTPGADPIADLADSLDYDPERIFRFVTDEVVYDAYEGALRGPVGTLASRAGNSVDQALLLGALLDAALVPHRFALAPISQDQATAILASRPADVDGERDRSARLLLPPDVAAAWTGPGGWPRLPEADVMFQQAVERVMSTVELVTGALEDAGVAILGPDTALPAGELGDHVWVQYQSGADWVDLDPTTPGSRPGATLGSPVGTLDGIPDDRYQTVTVRLAAEVAQGGIPLRMDLLTHTFRAADLVTTPVSIVHAPASWLDIAGALSGLEQYQPTLLVGDEVITGTSIALSKGQGVDDVFGDGTTADGQALAEWLEFDIAIPGGTTRTSSRLLFDRVPAEQRASGTIDLATLPPVELVDLGDLGRVFRPLAGTTLVSVVGGSWPAANLSQTDRPSYDDLVHDGAFAYHHLRDLLATQLLDQVSMTSWPDEPVIAVVRTVPTPGTGDGNGSADTVIDLHASHRRSRVLGGALVPGAPGIVAGAIDHAAERMIPSGAALFLNPGQDADEVSVGRVFELAAEAGVPTRVLAPDQTPDIEGLPPTAVDLIAAAQAQGRYLVIPAATVDLGSARRIGWWEFDPATGVVLDRMDDGGRAAASEYAGLIRVFTIGACAFAALGVITFIAKWAQGKLSTLTDFADSLASAGGSAAGCAAGGFALK